MATPSDGDLALRACPRDGTPGDPKAFSEIVRLHQRRIYRLSVHMLRDRSEAEDATQETFLRAYRALPKFEGKSALYTWLHRIAVHVCLNRLRSGRALSRPLLQGAKDGDHDARLEALPPAEDAQESADGEAIAARRELYRALAEGVDALSETLRTTLIVVCIEGFSHDEAAAILGAPAGTIAWRVHEARRKLTEYMSARGFKGAGT
jgi:RNA polymerase sigma-70 factor, ECF subfamily